MPVTIVCIALMAALLAFSDIAMDAARTALSCFGTGVLPALLPMMILGKMLPNYTKTEHSGKSLWLGSVFFALAAGSPASAQRAAGSRNRLSNQSWECLLCLTGVMSPMFFTGTLAQWTGDTGLAGTMLAAHWLGAAVAACIWRCFCTDEQRVPAAVRVKERVTLAAAITQAAQSMLGVCGAMMLFSMAAAIMQALLARAFPAWTAQNARLLAAGWAVLEIGGGAHAVIRAWDSPPAALLCALCSFGGLSLWLQNVLFAPKSVRPAKLLAMRALHGAVSWGICRLMLSFPSF